MTLRALALVLIAVGVWRIAVMLPTAAFRIDFAHYYLSARIALEGNNPYTTPLKPLCDELGMQYHPGIPYGANPPVLIKSMTFLARLSPQTAFNIWLAFQVAALALLFEMTRRLVEASWSDSWLLLWFAVALNCATFIDHFCYSQVQIPIAAALATGAWLATRGHGVAAFAIVSAAAVFKLYPAVLLPWFGLQGLRRWRDFTARTAVGAVVFGFALAVTGPAMWLSFANDGIPVIQNCLGRFMCNYSWQAVAVAFHNAFRDAPFGGIGSATPLAIGKLLAAAGVAAAYWCVWKRQLTVPAAVGLLSIAMVAASVVCWSHYFVLLLPVATLLIAKSRTAAAPLARYVAPVAAFLILMPKTGGSLPIGSGPWSRLWLHTYLLMHLYPAAVMLVLAGCIAAHPALRRSTKAA